MRQAVITLMLFFFCQTPLFGDVKVEKTVNGSYTDISYCLLKTHPLITEYGDLGEKTGTRRFEKDIEVAIPSPTHGEILIPCKRTIEYGLNCITIKIELDESQPVFEVNKLVYYVELSENKVTYYLEVESDYESQLKINMAFRIHVKKRHNKMLEKLKSLYEEKGE